jgi:hypothetical protein
MEADQERRALKHPRWLTCPVIARGTMRSAPHRGYLPRPDPFVGDIVQALADAGFFRFRGVLVGTVAFQCYAAILGVRLSNASMQTADADFAQFHSISVAVKDSIPPILDVLRSVDPSFRSVPHQTDSPQRTYWSLLGSISVSYLAFAQVKAAFIALTKSDFLHMNFISARPV